MNLKEAVKARFLAELPAPYGAQAVANFDENYHGQKYFICSMDLASLINYAFEWSKTPEGDDYWLAVYETLNLGGVEALKSFCGQFDWEEYPVIVYTDFITVGCQTVFNKEIILAQKLISGKRKKSFNLPSGWIVKKCSSNICIGGSDFSEKTLEELLDGVQKIRDAKKVELIA